MKIKPRKIPYYLLSYLLTGGAGLIIGLLSFSGMFTLVPMLSLAFSSLILSVAYEGEIYLQNIKGALNKLFFKQSFTKNYLAKQYLLEQFTKGTINTLDEDCPQFFKDYEAQLKLLSKFGHKRLDKTSQQRKMHIETTLRDMEKWFSTQLFSEEETLNHYEESLQRWFFAKSPFDVANQYLLAHFTQGTINTADKECPQFFKDYEGQLKSLNELSQKPLDKALRQQKQQIESTLHEMKKCFSSQLFSEKEALTDDEKSLQKWLKEHDQEKQKELLANWQHDQAKQKELLTKRQRIFTGFKLFSTIAGLFMSLGTTYLLVEAFAVIPLLATLPFAILPAIIVPMAIVAGAAYALLIYNAITDMINQDSIHQWYREFCKDFNKEVKPDKTKAVLAAAIFALTAALTICTAGTWWTVAKNTRPLFNWMSKFANFIAVGLVAFTGLAQLAFNLQNASESLTLINEFAKAEESLWEKIKKRCAKAIKAVFEKENVLQLLNLPRILLLLTFLPLRILLFIGHLVGIAVSSDRLPGIPEIASAILGFISEFFEDFHYFLGDLLHTHKHSYETKELLQERFGEEHGHDHSNDFPTRILWWTLSPLFLAAASWDWAATRLMNGDHPLTWPEAWARQTGQRQEEIVTVKSTAHQPSAAWKIEHTAQQIAKRIHQLNQAHLDPHGLAAEKIAGLQELRQTIRQLEPTAEPQIAKTQEQIKQAVAQEATKKIYRQHRHDYAFFQSQGKPKTQIFLEEELPKRIGACAA